MTQETLPLVCGHITGAPPEQVSASYPIEKLIAIARSQIPIDKVFAVETNPHGQISLREVGSLVLEFYPAQPPSFEDSSPEPDQIAPVEESPEVETRPDAEEEVSSKEGHLAEEDSQQKSLFARFLD